LKVCTCYGNDNVRIKSISGRIHENVLRMFDVIASKMLESFKSMWIMMLINRLSDVVGVDFTFSCHVSYPSVRAIRCNEIVKKSEDFLGLRKG
jgi:hypothetical protein